ncbi:glycosyl hydrolase family 18 protein [Aestuariibacter sp. AA17]|uniref:Glycosyl hydrolase family 18 protein n=1 Tax=Fluctibacter corallii TaxID=2984329 RepID=A0ABT3A694_9ALTE|nr:glycosyl hydrolase family 18 protein [Aestuariibacter sp. AA17]MCV2884164.1 glycosyl hydrolase family 18 protein [Aestuariibacter sp. AA17]
MIVLNTQTMSASKSLAVSRATLAMTLLVAANTMAFENQVLTTNDSVVIGKERYRVNDKLSDTQLVDDGLLSETSGISPRFSRPRMERYDSVVIGGDKTKLDDTDGKPRSVQSACKPVGLTQSIGTHSNYCDVYNAHGRERLGAGHSRRIIGYFTSWRTGKNQQPAYLVSDIPWEKVTHINYAFAHINENNQLSVGDTQSPTNAATRIHWPNVDGAEMDPAYSYQGHFNLLNKYKKQYPHVKSLISVGGWAETGGYINESGVRISSGGFYTMTTNPDGSINQQGITTFVDSAVTFIRQYGFDGVDIDYEYPTSMENAGHPDDFDIANPLRPYLNRSYQALMKALREGLDKAGQEDDTHYLLTIAAPSSGYLLRGMETFQVAQYLDFINIMSYDLHGAWNAHVGHQAALYDSGNDSELARWNVYNTPEFQGIGYLNTDWAVAYFRGAVAAGRINIGIPYYTRGFRDVQGGEHGLWGQAPLPDQNQCPKGTGIGENNPCGNGAIGIDNLWHDNDLLGNEVAAGSNPLWHTKNLEAQIFPSYAPRYGLTPDTDPNDQLIGQYQAHYDPVSVASWLWNPQKNVFLSRETEQSVSTKVDYVIDQGIGGVMIWELAGDYDYYPDKQEYFFGDTLTTLIHSQFAQRDSAYSVKPGRQDFPVPDSAVDVSFSVNDMPVGDANYPIAPTFVFTNHSDIDLSGGTISFDMPVSTSAVFRANWNANEKLGFNVVIDGGNTSGNNIGGFHQSFHRFSISLVNEWGGQIKSFKSGETIHIQPMYYLPVSGPINFTVEVDEHSYALKAEYPTLPDAVPPSDDGNPPNSECDDIDASAVSEYPNWPRLDWQGNPSHAITGDLLRHTNTIYRAKWWTNAMPSTSNAWAEVCSL